MTRTTLAQYYAAVDAGDFDTALSLVSEDVASVILLPGNAVRGNSRQDLRDYLSGRGEVVRRHVPLRQSIAEEVEFIYGSIVEDETTTTGHFIAACRVDTEGLITHYQVAFDPEFALLPDA